MYGGSPPLPSITPYHLRIECDDQMLEDDFFYGMVCNTISVGGMKALPTDRVVLDDGLFEVILVRKPTSITDLTDSLQALIRQEPPQSGAVLSFHASHLKFTAEKPIPWTLDGEYGGSHEINVVENCRQALTVMQGTEPPFFLKGAPLRQAMVPAERGSLLFDALIPQTAGPGPQPG